MDAQGAPNVRFVPSAFGGPEELIFSIKLILLKPFLKALFDTFLFFLFYIRLSPIKNPAVVRQGI